MKQSFATRFGKWFVKVVAIYAVFIAVGMLLFRIPAYSVGLSEKIWTDIRMFFMLFGPIYLTLIFKSILVIICAVKSRHNAADNKGGKPGEKEAADRGRDAALIVAGILLFVDLLSMQSAADLTVNYSAGKGLSLINSSKRYSAKSRRFLNVFVSLAFNLLILEVLTLLMCIVIFAPLSRIASNVFIFSIAITIMLLIMVPLIMAMTFGYKGSKAYHQQKADKADVRAAGEGYMILTPDQARRKEFLRLPRRLALLAVPACLLVFGFILFLTKDCQYVPLIMFLRQICLFFMACAFISFIPLLIYWANCSGTSLVMKLYLSDDSLFYVGYSGSMDERSDFSYQLQELTGYQVGKRSIRVNGVFIRKIKDRYGSKAKNDVHKNLWLPRVLPQEQEEALIRFLERKSPR